MVNKLQFNNWVISNKNAIERSRVQTINKLVQKSRKHDALLAKRPEDKKTKERLRKTVEIMNQLKKQKGLEIMKLVLVLDKEPSAVITNGLATPNEIAVATLAVNKSMADLIKRFKMEFNITNEDDNWKDVIMQASKRRLKFMKTEEKRRKRAELKEQKAIGLKRLEWLNENKFENKEFNEEKTNDADEVEKICTLGAWKIEKIGEENVKQKLSVKEKPTEGRKFQKNVRKPNTQNQAGKNGKNKAKQTPAIEAFDVQEKEVHAEAIEEYMLNTAENYTEVETHVVDPFFITEKGQNYLSTAVLQYSDIQQEVKHTQFNENKSIANLNSKFKHGDGLSRQRKHNAKQVGENSQTLNKRSKYSQNPTENQQRPVKRSSEACMRDFLGAGENQLHPSWAAKLKFKPIISNTQAKKIVFDHDLKPTLVNHELNSKINFSKRPVPNVATATETLHPSWSAKQKLKPTIADFQGKKTTFEYD